MLQGEDFCFYGTLLPTLETILRKTRAMKPEISMMTLGLAVCIEDSIKRRFNRVFESKNAILAAVSMPKFKLKWVEEVAKKDQCKRMFIDKMWKYNDETTVTEKRMARIHN